ncbi:hypothetical protein JZ751_020506 [Albula glossodonta]|uniref:Uncharacterized protein n=1 Tax=Albula glossodonta TaxID=121402 RepID=A0A8T2PFH8_9TELE|nr:hypothetical protein JZ751_020506 [Albula glossodonta]
MGEYLGGNIASDYKRAVLDPVFVGPSLCRVRLRWCGMGRPVSVELPLHQPLPATRQIPAGCRQRETRFSFRKHLALTRTVPGCRM